MPLYSLPRHGVRALAILALTALPLGAALAQGADLAVRGPDGASASPLATLGRLGLALVVVLIAFWGCARLMRRLQHVGEAGAGGLRVVGGLSLGQRERLVVVQAGDEQLLLGVSAGRIERLHVLDRPLGAPSSLAGGTPSTSAAGATSPTPATPAASFAPDSRDGAPADFRARLLSAMQRRVPS